MHVVRVQRKEAVRVGVDLAHQAARDSLANHRPLLARDGSEVVVDVWQDRLAERYIKVLSRPVGFAYGAIAQLEVVHAHPFTELSGKPMQRRDRFDLRACHSPIGAEGQ